ncbi:MAG TPA: TetR/AcrR family transcriptional regulator [Candidatus Scatomorpha gallistercoris]|nr:TetR/AcrR family transcriptional regulator [Candidatus Scatomorpha gallistercoris]
MKNENDLRIIKTRQNITDSFLALLAKKPLEEISVTEICAGAKCSRNTFYLHYPYKEALYDALMDELIDQVKQAFMPNERITGENFEDYALRHTRLMGQAALSVKDQLKPVLAGDHNDVFFRKLLNVLRDTLMQSTEANFGVKVKLDEKYRLICWYCASAMVGFLMACYYDVDIPDEEALDILCAMHSGPFTYGWEYISG